MNRLEAAQRRATILMHQLIEASDDDLRMVSLQEGRLLYDRSNPDAWVQYNG